MRNDAYRVRVDLNDYQQTYIPFELKKSFSFLNILSLKINQEGFLSASQFKLWRFGRAGYFKWRVWHT